MTYKRDARNKLREKNDDDNWRLGTGFLNRHYSLPSLSHALKDKQTGEEEEEEEEEKNSGLFFFFSYLSEMPTEREMCSPPLLFSSNQSYNFI